MQLGAYKSQKCICKHVATVKTHALSRETEVRNFENRKNIGKMLTVLSLNYYMPVGDDAGRGSVDQRVFDFIDNTAFVGVPLKPASRKSPYNCSLDSFANNAPRPQQSPDVQVH
jgi:hypothetical protein